MILKKPKFWLKKDSFISIILFPLTWIVLLTIFLKKKIIKPIKFNIPIICVGNIYIGGTGKTPVSIFLAKKLSEINRLKKPAIENFNLTIELSTPRSSQNCLDFMFCIIFPINSYFCPCLG